MANDSPLNTPVLWINKYLEDQIPLLTNIEVPFYHTLSNLN